MSETATQNITSPLEIRRCRSIWKYGVEHPESDDSEARDHHDLHLDIWDTSHSIDCQRKKIFRRINH